MRWAIFYRRRSLAAQARMSSQLTIFSRKKTKTPKYNFASLLFYQKSFSDLLVRLRSHPQIRFDFLITFGEFLF